MGKGNIIFLVGLVVAFATVAWATNIWVAIGIVLFVLWIIGTVINNSSNGGDGPPGGGGGGGGKKLPLPVKMAGAGIAGYAIGKKIARM